MTLRARLASAYLVLLTLCLSGFGFGVHQYASNNLYQQGRASVKDYGDWLTQLLSESITDPSRIADVVPVGIPQYEDRNTGGTEDSWAVVEVTWPETHACICFKSETLPVGNLPTVDEGLVAHTRTNALGHIVLYARQFRVETTADPGPTLGPRRTVEGSTAPPERFDVKVTVARSMESVDSTLEVLRNILIGGGVAVLVVTALLGLGVSSALLRPLERMRSAARRIGGTRDFHLRLPVSNPRHELGRLSVSVNQMLSELEQSHASLMSALEAQRRFVGDASHELRTPVTAIRTNLEFLRRAPDADRHDRTEALADAVTEISRMEQLIGNLLALARLEAGAAQDRGPLRLDQLLADVARDARRMASPGVEVILRSRTGRPPVWVSGNQEDLRRAVWNLVENALKYLQQPRPELSRGAPAAHDGKGGAEHAGAGTIALRLTVDAGFAVMTVHDTGIGISEEDQRLVFDRFWRATQARGQAGSGLGLAITKWVAQAHGGSVSVSSKLGDGSTFTLRLPRIAAPSEPPTRTSGKADPQTAKQAAAR